MKKGRISIEYLERPGLRKDPFRNQQLLAGLRQVGRKCFRTLPEYQCFASLDALNDKVITVARNRNGAIVGFSSALLVKVDGLELPVLHLGLTCVDPEYRGRRLTHKLASKLTIGYLLRHNPLGKVWLSNVACVLSSIGNVALNFDDVYPAPFTSEPSTIHKQIARTIDQKYRKEIYINEDAWFDESCFVMRGSVRNTVFQKEADATRFHHRNQQINAYYQSILDFGDGDEVVQIGSFSWQTFARYLVKGAKKSEHWFPAPKRTERPRLANRAA